MDDFKTWRSLVISSANNSTSVYSYDQVSPQETQVPKTGARDSYGDNDGNKPGEVEQSEQGRNNTSGYLIDEIV